MNKSRPYRLHMSSTSFKVFQLTKCLNTRFKSDSILHTRRVNSFGRACCPSLAASAIILSKDRASSHWLFSLQITRQRFEPSCPDLLSESRLGMLQGGYRLPEPLSVYFEIARTSDNSARRVYFLSLTSPRGSL